MDRVSQSEHPLSLAQPDKGKATVELVDVEVVDTGNAEEVLRQIAATCLSHRNHKPVAKADFENFCQLAADDDVPRIIPREKSAPLC